MPPVVASAGDTSAAGAHEVGIPVAGQYVPVGLGAADFQRILARYLGTAVHFETQLDQRTIQVDCPAEMICRAAALVAGSGSTGCHSLADLDGDPAEHFAGSGHCCNAGCYHWNTAAVAAAAAAVLPVVRTLFQRDSIDSLVGPAHLVVCSSAGFPARAAGIVLLEDIAADADAGCNTRLGDPLAVAAGMELLGEALVGAADIELADLLADVADIELAEELPVGAAADTGVLAVAPEGVPGHSDSLDARSDPAEMSPALRLRVVPLPGLLPPCSARSALHIPP